jgi:hypothetical protein
MQGGSAMPSRSEVEQSIVDWLVATREGHDLSWERWADLAGTSGTNITRFLKHGRPVPKLGTLYALADAVGAARPSFGATLRMGKPIDRVPVIAISVLQLRGWEQAMLQAVDFREVSPNFAETIAFKVTADTARFDGILPGDFVICARTDPQPGQQVAVAEGEGCAVYRWHPPHLIPATPGAPPIPCDSRMVLGVVRQVQRDVG